MNLSRLAVAIGLAPCLLPAVAADRDAALRLSDTLITANRDVQDRRDASTAASVFTRADIERLRPNSVLDLLTHVPGVQVANYGGRGALYGLYIRGTSSAQSLVLIDGVRVGSATSGMAGLQYLSVEQIERVEVLRGSRSALYGADAMGGVVQIFTRRGQGMGLNPSLRVSAGSHGTFEHSLGLSGGDERTQFSVTAGLEESQGFDRTRTSHPLDADDDAYRNRSVSANVSHRISDTLQVGFNVLDQRGKTETDDPFATAPGSLPYDDFQISSSLLFAEAQLSPAWNSRLELGHSEDKQENRKKGTRASTVNNSYRDSINWLNRIELNEANTLRVGAEYLNDKVRSSNAFAEPSRKNHALYAQHSYQADGFATELGMRHDKNEQFGSANTFNGALTLPLNADNQLILSYAEGFRVPTFADLYWPDEGWYKGNPNIKPEHSKSYELQWRSQLTDTARLETSLYRTDFRDLITYVSDPVTYAGTMDNVARARVNGFEATLYHQLLGFDSALGVAVIDARDRQSGHNLANRAKRTLSWELDRRFGDFSAGATLRAVSGSYANAANDSELSGYGTLDLRAAWQATSELVFDVKWSNVLDKDYSRLQYSYATDGVNYRQYGYQEAPAQVLVGLTWTPSL